MAFAAPGPLLRTVRNANARTTAYRTLVTAVRKSASVPLGGGYTVEVLPILSDNFCYLLANQKTKTAYAVDPAEPGPVEKYLGDAGLNLVGILCTHHHWDHAGGNDALVAAYPKLPVYALDTRVDAANYMVSDGDEFKLAFGVGSDDVRVHVLHTPCHTSGHCCFHIPPGEGREKGIVFTGDTLFVGGCGKFFEGDGYQMQSSMDKLNTLDDDTLVFCGHEYTTSNMRFAAAIDENNPHVAEKLEWVLKTVATGTPTVPTTIGEEKKHNPFMRTKEPALAAAVGKSGAEPAVVMTAVRAAKDNFRGR